MTSGYNLDSEETKTRPEPEDKTMNTATMTYDEIIANEKAAREEYESRETYKGFTIATLRKVTDAVFSKEHWKKPWATSVHHSLVMAVLAGTEFFHADKAEIHGTEPITGYVLMSGKGYQAD